MVKGPVYGGKCGESLANYDLDSQSWKTSQTSLFGEVTEYSVPLPRSGMMRNGVLYPQEEVPLIMSEPHTNVKEYGLWPTPSVCGNYNRKGASATSADGLATAVKKNRWPTPTARDWKDTSGMSLTSKNPDGSTRDRTDRLPGKIYAMEAELGNTKGGSLNPTFVK